MTTHSKKIGDIEVTALSDGVLATSIDVVLGMDRAEVRRLAGSTDGDGLHIAVNAFLLKLQGRWALIDAGAGIRCRCAPPRPRRSVLRAIARSPRSRSRE
jgi:hypothetical protein